MVDYDQRLKELDDELKNTPYNKRTQHAVGLLKAKIARLKDTMLTRASKGGGGYSYAVRKSGDASVVLVGYPSVGKSTLLNALTNANSAVGAYAFTTLDVVPGVMEYKHAKIQILDVPGILKGAALGKGRGREVLSVVRNADMVLLLVDIAHPEHLPVLKKELYDSGLRINEEKPDVKIKKKARGGISIGTTVKLSKLTKRTAQSILREFHINNADVVIRTDITAEQLIDMIEDNKHYLPGIIVLTKADMAGDALGEITEKVHPDICISAETGMNIAQLKESIFSGLRFIRIYCKEVGKKPDLNVPLIMRKGTTVRDVCNSLHREFVSRFKTARVWGSSAKFPGQKQGLGHILKDSDIVEINVD